MRKVSVINIIIGFIILGIVFIRDIGGEVGFSLFCIGSIMIISGILLNKKLRELVINFILNFI